MWHKKYTKIICVLFKLKFDLANWSIESVTCLETMHYKYKNWFPEGVKNHRTTEKMVNISCTGFSAEQIHWKGMPNRCESSRWLPALFTHGLTGHFRDFVLGGLQDEVRVIFQLIDSDFLILTWVMSKEIRPLFLNITAVSFKLLKLHKIPL